MWFVFNKNNKYVLQLYLFWGMVKSYRHISRLFVCYFFHVVGGYVIDRCCESYVSRDSFWNVCFCYSITDDNIRRNITRKDSSSLRALRASPASTFLLCNFFWSTKNFLAIFYDRGWLMKLPYDIQYKYKWFWFSQYICR